MHLALVPTLTQTTITYNTLTIKVPGFLQVYTEVERALEGENGQGRKPRADGVLLFDYEGEVHLLVVELKFGGSAGEAMQQICQNKYVERVIEYVKDKYGVMVSENCIHIVGMTMSNTDHSKNVVVDVVSEPYEQTY